MKALLFTLLLNGFAVNTVFAESSSTMLELDSIEKSLTNDISLSDKRLNKLSRNNTSFSSEELYYFKFRNNHSELCFLDFAKTASTFFQLMGLN